MTTADAPSETPFPTGEPWSGSEIDACHRQLLDAGSSFLRRIPGGIFFTAQGDRWSPAEHTRHLTKSARPLVPALRLPSWVTALLFGRASRPSRTFAALREEYRRRLAGGAQAGRFAPSPKPAPSNLDQGRDEIVAHWRAEVESLRASANRWSESALDRRRLPHPLLGKLTVREMLLFMLYHDAHHLRLVAGRLPEGVRERALGGGGAT